MYVPKNAPSAAGIINHLLFIYRTVAREVERNIPILYKPAVTNFSSLILWMYNVHINSVTDIATNAMIISIAVLMM